MRKMINPTPALDCTFAVLIWQKDRKWLTLIMNWYESFVSHYLLLSVLIGFYCIIFRLIMNCRPFGNILTN